MTGIFNAALWRYNYKIIWGVGFWILVLPVAATQIVTLWMFVLQHDFSQSVAATVAELMTPISGAFLAAHALAPEYRSGISAVLSCKPVSLLRVASLRVVLGLLISLLLTWVSLRVCSMVLSPVDIEPVMLAAIPSLLFLAMVALTMATMFRSSLGGFAVAAGLWAVDLHAGHTANPLFSLQGMAALEDGQPLAHLWLVNKGVLLISALLLLLWQSRLLRRLGRGADRADLTRVVIAVSLLLAFYVVSGAGLTIAYAWRERGHLPTRDITWVRRQMNIYAPLPMPALFGPAFRLYVSQPGEKDLRVNQLRAAVRQWPGSIWADSLAYDLGTEQLTTDPASAARDFTAVADLYPSSPFAPVALGDVLEIETGIEDEMRVQAARRLVADYVHSDEVDKAMIWLEQLHPGQIDGRELKEAALRAGTLGPVIIRARWLALAADLQEEEDPAAARRTAQAAVAAGNEVLGKSVTVEEQQRLGRYRTQVQQGIARAEQVLARLGR